MPSSNAPCEASAVHRALNCVLYYGSAVRLAVRGTQRSNPAPLFDSLLAVVRLLLCENWRRSSREVAALAIGQALLLAATEVGDVRCLCLCALHHTIYLLEAQMMKRCAAWKP